MRKRDFVVAIITLVIVAGGVSIFFVRRSASRAESKEVVEAEALPAVKASNRVVSEAIVVPLRSAVLSLASGGIVAEVLVREGDRVDGDQLLVRLNSARLAASVKGAEARLARAHAVLAQLRTLPYQEDVAAARAALAQTVLEQLRSAEEAVAVRAAANAQVERAEARLDALLAGARPEETAAAEADVAAAAADLAQARAALAETQLNAPFAGTVASLDVKVGEQVAPGNPIVRLADLSEWQIETTDLTELSIISIAEGDEVIITLDAIPDLELPGSVSRIKVIGENRHGDMTYTVIVKPDYHDDRLRWNMTASVSIEPVIGQDGEPEELLSGS